LLETVALSHLKWKQLCKHVKGRNPPGELVGN